MPLRILLAGILLLTATGLGLIGYQATHKARPAPIATPAEVPQAPLIVNVLAATQSLPAGTLIKEQDFTRRSVPSSEMPDGALLDTSDARAGLRGALLRRYMDAGSILLDGDVLHPRDRGFLAAVLLPGARAFSVGVDAISGNGGLIWPGDRVDVILTQQLDEKDAPLAKRFVGETVLSDVRVVAVDQSIAQGAVAGGDNATGRVARTITLEVTPQQAERAAVADRLGRLALSLRPAEGASDVPGNRVYSGDVSSALSDGGTSAAPRMRVVEGKDAREVVFQ